MALLEVNDANFEQEVLQASEPVLVDFWAPWCGPCRLIAPVVEELSKEFEGKLKVVKLNTDDNQAVPQQYHISGIPSLLLFKGGEVVEQKVGAVPKNKIEEMLSAHL